MSTMKLWVRQRPLRPIAVLGQILCREWHRWGRYADLGLALCQGIAREGSCVWKDLKSTELMSLTWLPFQIFMKSGGWNHRGSRSLMAPYPDMYLRPTQPTGKWLFNLAIQMFLLIRILNVLSQSTIWFWIKKGKALTTLCLCSQKQGPSHNTPRLGYSAFQSWNRAGPWSGDSLVSKPYRKN